MLEEYLTRHQMELIVVGLWSFNFGLAYSMWRFWNIGAIEFTPPAFLDIRRITDWIEGE